MAAASIRAVFMGSDAIALPFLREARSRMVGEVEWIGVFTQPDRRSGRGMKLQVNPIKEWAIAEGLPVRQPERCGPEDEAWLAAAGVELIVVMAYGQFLKRSLLELPALGALNFHASVLPQLRGASPIATALAEGWSETGVSLMKMVLKMDAGPVADVERVPILRDDTLTILRDRIAGACIPLWERAVTALRGDGLQFAEQQESDATYCRMLRKEDAWLDFTAPAEKLDCRIRAFHTWPGAIVPHRDIELKIGEAAAVSEAPTDAEPGTIVFDSEGLPQVVCGQGSLQLRQLQKPGGRMLPVREFLRGYPLSDGDLLDSRPTAPLIAYKPFKRS